MCVQSVIISLSFFSLFFYHKQRSRLFWACFHWPACLFLSRYLATLPSFFQSLIKSRSANAHTHTHTPATGDLNLHTQSRGVLTCSLGALQCLLVTLKSGAHVARVSILMVWPHATWTINSHQFQFSQTHKLEELYQLHDRIICNLYYLIGGQWKSITLYILTTQQ